MYLSIFITLGLGSLLFGLAMWKQETVAEKVEVQSQIIKEDTEESANQLTEEKQEESEYQIDIQKLLPSRTLALDKFSEELLRNMSDTFNIVQGLFYIKNPNEDLYHCYAQYAYFSENKPSEFRTGETLPGQAVKNKAIVSINDIPEKYMTVASGLGKSNPKHLVFVPIKNQDDVLGLIEYATFETLSGKQFKALEGISKKVADVISKHFKK